MRRIVLLFSILVTAATAHAQRVQRGTAPLVGIADVGAVADPFTAQVVSLEAPAPDGNVDKTRLREIKAEVERRFPPKAVPGAPSGAKTTAAPLPIVERGFVGDSLSGIPPDNYNAVGRNGRVVSVVNSVITVMNDSGRFLRRITLNTFALAAGLPYSPTTNPQNYKYDPKIIYDAAADRYISVILNGVNGANYIIVGFSQTADPAGTWAFYKFYGDYAADTTWFDYPTVALTKNEFFLTGNKILYNGSWQAGFRQSVIYQFRKADGYAGAANLTYQLWDSIGYGGRPIRNLFPVKGGTSGLQGPDQFFLSNRNFDVQNDTVFLVRLPDTIGAANQILSIQALKSNLAYGVPPNGRQRGTTLKLATNDGRILGAFAEGSSIQFVSATNVPATGASGIYHGRIANYRTAPQVTASVITVDTLDFGYPNITSAARTAGAQDALISFNYTGPARWPGLAAVNYDGIDHSPVLSVKEGSAYIVSIASDPVQRWGDYTGSQIDPLANGSAWIYGIFGVPVINYYGNWMARIMTPAAYASVHTPKTAASADFSVFPNPAFHGLRVRFSLAQESVVRFSILDVQGRTVGEVTEARCRAGQSEISLNIASLAPGTYVLRGTAQDGTVLVTERFVKQ